MRIKETTVYQYDELSDTAKQKAREEASQFLTETWDGSATIEDVTENITPLLGIELDKDGIAYSGFCSQGDGASFTGTWRAVPEAEVKVREFCPTDTELQGIAVNLSAFSVEFPGCVARVVRRSSHYCHEYTVGIDAILCYDAEDNETMVPAEAETRLFETLQRFMRWIYKQLEAEYEYCTADAQVVDFIEANEYEYNESGGME